MTQTISSSEGCEGFEHRALLLNGLSMTPCPYVQTLVLIWFALFVVLTAGDTDGCEVSHHGAYE